MVQHALHGVSLKSYDFGDTIAGAVTEHGANH
jgi:hypothetical protein